jgi:F5/8 type C domain/Bacterial alpha-L-rhamnosidase 6 hairpin glycosidase domain
MHTRLLDAFTDLSDWLAVTSGQAKLAITTEPTPHGQAMRLDFDFAGGGGFVVARKPFAFTLPETFAFHFAIRGAAPPNKFEFKLVDPAGVNVWRYQEDAFDFAADWRKLSIPSSRIDFAWGPAGGGAPADIGAIEFAVSAGPGGQGTLWIADLRLEDRTVYAPPRLRASAALPGHDPACAMDGRPETSWRSGSLSGPAWLEIDFGQVRDYGGLILHWTPSSGERRFTLQACDDGREWRSLYSAPRSAGEYSYVYLPGGASRYLQLEVEGGGATASPGVIAIEVQPFDFSRSIHAFFHHVAGHGARGRYPRWLYREQTYWTPVDIPDGAVPALLNEDGLLEVDRGSFSLEPFLYVDGALLSWAGADISQTLEEGSLPLPSVVWQCGDLRLTTTAFVSGPPGRAVLHARYRVENHGPRCAPTLFVAVRPLQVTPTWQGFEDLGGVSPVRELAYREGVLWVNGTRAVIPLSPAVGFGAAIFDQGPVSDYLAGGELPLETRVRDDFGYASGALRFDLDLARAAAGEIYLAVPFGPIAPGTLPPPGDSGPEQFELARRQWSERLGAVDFRLPPPARAYLESCRSATAHILINRDGPALQPGPRRYTRAWIRDGAVMAAALLRMGCSAEAGEFIRWYASFQGADGNVPCCVDRKGPDWLAEHDSHGEFIFAVADYYRYSGDRRLVEDLWPAVRRAVDYLEQLRSQRLTPAWREADKQACFGLLPESVSHEGYLAQPVHAYWDDFWALRGFKDAAELAEVMGDPAEAARFAALRDDFRATLCASLRHTMSARGIEFLPGSVEWADPDPTAVANALTLVDEAHNLPSAALRTTFARFLERFRAMHAGQVAWTNYTPYEIRIIGALVRLGQRVEAHELARFFLAERRPPAWNQWPEIAWRDPRTPGHQGDLPHSWIGAEYVLVFHDLFAYECDADQSLVVAAGIPADWLAAGEVAVSGLPTRYGRLNLRLHREADGALHLGLDGTHRLPPGGFRFAPPGDDPVREVSVNGEPTTDFTPSEARITAFPAEVFVTR